EECEDLCDGDGGTHIVGAASGVADLSTVMIHKKHEEDYPRSARRTRSLRKQVRSFLFFVNFVFLVDSILCGDAWISRVCRRRLGGRARRGGRPLIFDRVLLPWIVCAWRSRRCL